MKNSKNKIFAAVVCGLIAGSVGTSVLGKFESNSKSVSSNVISNSNSNNDTEVQGNQGTNNNVYDNNNYEGVRPQRGNHHKGAASIGSTESVDVASGSYADGTYEGTAAGYAEGLTVSVEISEGKISDIQIVNSNETPGFCERAFETVPAEIIQNQSTAVDTVSGATYSSTGIINAVNDALSQATN